MRTHQANHPFRVFVSYSHGDRNKARRVVDALGELGLRPLWDEDIHGANNPKRRSLTPRRAAG